MRYFAFISYSRKDAKIAYWLHNKLEKYPYPGQFVRIENRPDDPKLIRPIFIDLKDLQPNPVHSFDNDIKDALSNSKYLILICSKNSAQSIYVDQEIRFFLQTHDNDYSRIVPLFVDEVTDDSIPPAIVGTSVMHRHFPIFSSSLTDKSEANVYCFYQMVAYMLGVDFSIIYNRYEAFSEKKLRQRNIRFWSAIAFLVVIIIASLYAFMKQRQLINFERNVFPKAVVLGYDKNFLRPVINHLKERNQDFHIYVHMPVNTAELTHRDRISDIAYSLNQKYGLKLLHSHLNTSMHRGSPIFRIASADSVISGNAYLDFASTTTSFVGIAEYKKRHEFYHSYSVDNIIREYTDAFIKITNEELKNDSVYVSFYTDKDALIDALAESVHLTTE